MSRPTDWDALGLHGDPTPGDPARIRTVAESIGSLGKTARKIDTAMETVLNKTGPETFVGQTAEELRNQISGRLRGFVQSIADAFEWSSGALTTYADAMSDAQSKADAALDQGRGLSQDDPDRDTLAANAKAAGSAQSEAAKTATSTLRKSSGHIKSPVSPCAEFWEIFQWIAIALVIPALIFGGPVALLAIAVNLTLFIKTAVDFAEGKAGILDLFLSALGLIAPSTRALPILSLLTKGANLLKNGIKAASIASLDLFKDMLRGIAKPFVALPSLHDLALVTGSWTKAGGLWVMGIGKGLGQLGATIVKSGALFVIKGITGIPGLVKGIGPAVTKFGVSSASWAKAEFGGAKWLRIFLPAEGDEIGEFGVFGATKIALIDRGVFGKFRFGAVPPATVRPTVQAVGSGVSHIPTPATVHNVNPLVDIPTHDLAATRIQVDQWTNALGPMPLPHAPGAAGFTAPGLLVPNPPALTIGTDFGAPLTFSHQASLRMDALLDIPVGKLSSVQIGDWANITHGADGVTIDAAPAFSKLPEPVAGLFTPPPVHIAVGADHAGVSGIPNPTIHQLTASIAPPAVVHQATDLVLPPAAVHAAIPTPDAAHLATTAPPSVHIGVDAAATVHVSPISHLEVATATVPTPHLGGLSDSHITATIAHHVATDLGPAATAGTGHAIADITPTPVLAHTVDVTPATVTATPPPSVVHTVNATTTPVTVTPPPAALHTVDVHTANVHTANVHAVDVNTAGVNAANAHTVDVRTTNVNAADVHTVDAHSVDVNAAGIHPVDVHTASVHSVDVNAASLATPPPSVVHTVDATTVPATATPPPAAVHTVTAPPAPVALTHDATPPTITAATAPTPGAAVPPVATAHYGTHAGTDLPQPAESAAGLGGKGKAPAAFTAPGDLDLPPAQRLGAAMDLLDHGGTGHFGGSAFRTAPTPPPVHALPAPQPVHATPAHATPAHGEPPHVDPASVQPAHVDPAGVQPAHVDPAHLDPANVPPAHVEPANVAAAHAVPVAQPPRTQPPRLTGKELDQAWDADSERVGALFGGADDPMTVPRTEAWGRFQLAAHDLQRAEQHVDYLASFPGGPSHGVSPLDHAQVRLGEARQTFADSVRQLREVGVNPVAMDHALRDLTLQSLKERPRLLGGASGVPVIAVDGVDGGRLVEVVPLGGGGGVPRGSAVHITYTRDGVHAHLELPGESAAAPHTVTVQGDGSLRVDHPGAAGGAPAYQVFDPIGDHLWDGHRITTGGTDTGALEFPAPGNGAPARWIGPDGTPVPGHSVVAETDAAGTVTGLKVVQDGTGGEFVRYDPATGAAVGVGAPLRGADGTVHGFAVMPADAIGAGHVEGLAGDLRPGRAMDHLGGGIRVETGGAPGRPATYTLYDATRTHIGDGRQLLDENGHFFGYAQTPPGAHGGTLVDGGWAPVPHRAVRVDLAADGTPATVRVTDTARGDYRTFDPATGALGDHAVMLHGFDDRQLGRFGVTRHPAPAPAAAGAAPPAPVHLGLDAHGNPVANLTHHGGDWRITRPGGGPAAGEYRQFGADGRLTVQRVNVTRDGRAVPDRHFDLRPGQRSWQLVDGNGAAVTGAGRDLLHSGTIDVADDAGRIRLVAKPGGTTVEIFDRRPLPGGGALDSVRSIDSTGFVRWNGSQRTRWTQVDGTGATVNWGTRHYGTMDGKDWKGVDHNLRTVHDFRQGVNGSVFAYKDGGTWRWMRYDKPDRVPVPNATGTRGWDWDGGWTDRLGDDGTGAVAQRQWGPAHLPQGNALQYKEFTLDANGAPRTVTVTTPGGPVRHTLWNSQSPHGKPTGALEQLPGGGGMLEVTRWSEQRPPQWVRRNPVIGMGIPAAAFDGRAWLKGDTRFQMSHWTLTDPATGAQTHGYRFTGMNESSFDLAPDGTLVRGSFKLGNGNTLKVGDTVPLPAGVHADPNFTPWTEGAGHPSGHRVDTANMPDGRIWEDRFDPAAGPNDWYHPNRAANWQVARAGYADGTVREFKVTGGLADPHVSVLKDPHGAIVGRTDQWPGADGAPHTVEMSVPSGNTRWNFTGYDGRADTRSWFWTDRGDGTGAPTTGPVTYGRGYNGPTPYDDSFVHFERGPAGDRAVRVRTVLDSHYVDSWRVTDPATGAHSWQWQKFDRAGRPVDYGAGAHVRQWWDPSLGGGRGGWSNTWVDGATRFQDTVVAHGAAPVVVREVPATAVNGRVREFLGGGVQAPPAGTWKEFDHGAVVRERTALPGGGFLEKDGWLGQWRHYDAAGHVIAQRTAGGFVWESDAFGRFHITGREVDFRGAFTELRGWGRRIREANRLQWDFAGFDAPRLGEALYQPQWKLIAEKAAIEFFQEFILEFTANLAINAIVADIQNKPFTGKDALKAFANASVSSGLKTAVGTVVHDNRLDMLRHSGDWRMGLANIDGGKGWNRHPFNHDKHWSNEWAGNETPIRWRGGAYDFAYSGGVSVLSGWVNGSMNAAVFGVTDADGHSVTLSGGAAALDGLVSAASSLTGTVTTGLGKNLVLNGLGARLWHRQGFGDFVAQFAFKLPEKMTTWALTNLFRADLHPSWYVPAPAPVPEPAPVPQPAPAPTTQGAPQPGPDGEGTPQK